MQKGVFTTWIKELCALVFVQTIQAFILAIVLSIILTFLFPTIDESTGVATVSDQSSVSALGVLCIILLTSLTKMEQITKKIFGLDSGILQNKPPHGLMASYMALKSLGRVFNNIPKMAGGIGGIIGAGTDKKKAQATMLSRLDKRGLDKNGNPVNGAAPQVNEGTGENNLLDGNEYYEKAKQAKQNGDMDGYRRNMGIQAGINKAKNAMAQNATSPSRLNKMDKTQDDYLKIMDKYDDEISKAKAKRRQGFQDLASGFAETAAATVGGGVGLSAGLISGLATNDLDQISKATAYGIGTGDALGENLAKAVSTVSTGVSSKVRTNSALDKQISKMEQNLKITNSKRESQAKRIKNITTKIEKDIGLQ